MFKLDFWWTFGGFGFLVVGFCLLGGLVLGGWVLDFSRWVLDLGGWIFCFWLGFRWLGFGF